MVFTEQDGEVLVLETLSSVVDSVDSEEDGEDFTAQALALVILSSVVSMEVLVVFMVLALDSATHFLVVSTALGLDIHFMEDLEVLMVEIIAMSTPIEVTQEREIYLEVIMLTIGQTFLEQIQIDQDLM